MKQRHSLPPGTRIDVHCHLFNKKILSWRLLIDFVQSRVNLPIPMRASNDQLLDGVSGLLKTVKQALHFLKIGMQPTSEEVYKTLTETENGYAVVPLMFDLDYCMKGAPADLQDEILTTCKQILLNDQKELRQTKQNTDYLTNSSNQNNEIDGINEIDEIGQLIQTIDNLLKLKNETNDANEFNGSNKFDFTHEEAPFLDQENQLIDLQKKYPDKVFPFYAVDPRREENYVFENGTYNLRPILNRLAINGGHFYGIKLYAPNGYSPADPMLMALYQYCEENAIPITAHCSGGGFASFAKTVNIQGLIYQDDKIQEYNGSITFKHYEVTDKERVHEKAQMLNHPLIWEKVLEKYPKLTLNLAHFGNSEGTEEWSQHIIRLMEQYPNLYTDFSCVTEKDTLCNMYNTYYAKAEPTIKSRFLYGSDFYLNMLFIDNMKQYISQFEEIFSANEMKEIMEINPRRFLSMDNWYSEV
jgi:predicted TIM-barrel fold metal-dependent hydrolase